ncbi:MAG: 50S ribosomal protein L24 [Candidatus Dojkabacteria bacterium]|nr:50S ribosomal protein L24 [Candidatus Dojkabacteria bacterium]
MRKIKTGDFVQVMRGKEKGKRGKVLKVLVSKNGSLKVVVEGVNIVKKAQKPNPTLGIAGGIIEKNLPIDYSNVMLVDPKLNVPTRVGIIIDKKTGKKYRLLKKSGEKIV